MEVGAQAMDSDNSLDVGLAATAEIGLAAVAEAGPEAAPELDS